MVINLNNIIESILKNTAVWISGPYGSGKTSILNQVKEFFINENYEVKFCYIEHSDTHLNLFYKITSRIVNISERELNLERLLNQLLEKIKENHKKGLVMIIDELDNSFRIMDRNKVDSIGLFIQFLAEFTLNYDDVFLIISSQELLPIETHLSKILDKFYNVPIR